jgi:hypothetical protein
MTQPADVCAAGSRPQTGFNVLLAVGAMPLKRMLPHDMTWVGDYLGLFGTTINLTGDHLCASGPAADPQLTGPEIAAGLADFGGPAFDLVAAKLSDIAQRVAWYGFCECSDGAAPIRVPSIPAPVDRPLINPAPPDIPPTAQPCLVDTTAIGGKNGDSYFAPIIILSGQDVTALQVIFGPSTVTGPFAGGFLEWQTFAGPVAGGTPTGKHRVTLTPTGGALDFVMPVPPGTQQIGVLNSYAGTDPSGRIDFHTPSENLFCGLAPGQPLDLNCCPPDPTVMQTLELILQLVQNIHSTSSPTSWIDGAVHIGVQGAGSFPLSGKAIGIRVDMTRLPENVRVNPGDPTFFWDAGFITPVALTSPLRGARLVFEHQSFQIPPFTDTIAWTLLHNCEVTITELLPVSAAEGA